MTGSCSTPSCKPWSAPPKRTGRGLTFAVPAGMQLGARGDLTSSGIGRDGLWPASLLRRAAASRAQWTPVPAKAERPVAAAAAINLRRSSDRARSRADIPRAAGNVRWVLPSSMLQSVDGLQPTVVDGVGRPASVQNGTRADPRARRRGDRRC
jgi:hypothetical protein